jgi:hypothetical protein
LVQCCYGNVKAKKPLKQLHNTKNNNYKEILKKGNKQSVTKKSFHLNRKKNVSIGLFKMANFHLSKKKNLTRPAGKPAHFL